MALWKDEYPNRTSLAGTDYMLVQDDETEAAPLSLIVVKTAAGYFEADGTKAFQFDTSEDNFFFGPGGEVPTGTGQNNLGIGKNVLQGLTDGVGNVAMGLNALQAVTTGSDNVAVGANTLKSATTIVGCTAVGRNAQENNLTGTNSTAVGDSSLQANTASFGHVAMGYLAANAHLTGNFTVAIGADAMRNHVTGAQNTAVGMNGMGASTTGEQNTALGFQALYSTNGDRSVAAGVNALGSAASGPNTAVGYRAGVAITTGTGNIFIGCLAGADTPQKADASNCIVIGDGAVAEADNMTVIGNDATAETCLRGRVAIGYGFTPTRRVHVRSTDSYTTLRLDGANGGQVVFGTPAGEKWSIYSESTGELVIYDFGSSAPRLTIHPDGQVQLGVQLTDAADDAAAAMAGVPVRGFYRSGSDVKIRVS